ncbi:MAG: hypothetical protein MJE77_12740 [Proteobacteria bacterium]|nr:hypothetical protein [Pseudomonadota bacterium]
MSRPRTYPAREAIPVSGCRFAGIAVIAAISTAACNLSVDDLIPDREQGEPILEPPSLEQVVLDLPRILKLGQADNSNSSPHSGADSQVQEGDDPGSQCHSEDSPGREVACLILGHAVEEGAFSTEQIYHLMRKIAEKLAQYPLPTTASLSVLDDGLRIEASWSQDQGNREFTVDFFDDASDRQLGHWHWTARADETFEGSVAMHAELFERAQQQGGDFLQGVILHFRSNADGSDKQLTLRLVIDQPGGEGSGDDPGAPTAMHFDASKEGDQWTVRIGTYHPTWLAPEIDSGVPTAIMVNAVAGTSEGASAVMNAIALGVQESLPRDQHPLPDSVLEEHSLCSYITREREEAGVTPPGSGQSMCGDNNPFYLDSQGTIIEGGPPPLGFESLANQLADIGFIAATPAELESVDLGF